MSRRHPDSLIFDTIRLEGSLFVPALLEKAARGDHSEQTAAHYLLPKGLSLADEQGRAFRIAGALWKGFEAVRPRRDVDRLRATTGFSSELLRDALGYSDFNLCSTPIEIQGRHYPVTALARGQVPVIVAPHDLDLDTPDERFAVIGSGTRRKSAYQLAQQFLNASQTCTWALVTNGRQIRLLRDSDTLTRPAYLEFDLELILANDRYADFTALWRLLHSSRAQSPNADGAECVWERWKREGEVQGERVRDGLRTGVKDALLALGNGFLEASANVALRSRIESGELSKDAYFQQLLRLVYRFLFLFTVEERGLLHSSDESAGSRETRDIYSKGYALRRLRDRSLRRAGFDRFTDLWTGLQIVFRGLASGEPRLALPALGGLFAASQCPDLDGASLENRALLSAMRHLRWSSATGTLAAVDYRNMGPEELGSVYESLLELVPTIELPARRFGFLGLTDQGSNEGNARKTSGSYYTPDALVQELLDSALDPVIEARIAARPEDPVAALLELSVIDPACGSAHFLLGAARRIAERLAELRAMDGAVRPEDYRHALREVIAHCVYGVDRNPMAIELARTALWLEGYDPGQPLSFLDHHLVCGDALLGLIDFKQLQAGIAGDAFKPLSGDHAETCRKLAAVNRAALKEFGARLHDKSAWLFDEKEVEDIFTALRDLEAMPDRTTGEVEAKRTAYDAFRDRAGQTALAQAADVAVAAFLAPKEGPADLETCPTTATLLRLLFPEKNDPAQPEALARAKELCREARVFHWPLAFPQIFARGGFDCVLGNPPWERIKIQEEEFFATREPLVASARNKAERGQRIRWLSEGSLAYHIHRIEVPPEGNTAELRLYREFISARRVAEAASAVAHVDGKDGGRYPLTGVGDVNTYALFSETIARITSAAGRSGFIVPMGIATDDTTKAFFASLISKRCLAQLIGLFEIRAWFPATDDRKAFCLLTLGQAEKSRFIFDVKAIEDLQQEAKWIELPPEDLILINPNTRTCPIFRARADAELTRAIYRRVPVLIEEARGGQPEKNPWAIRFQAMFHMSADSGLFQDQPRPDLLPLYEAKMIHQFDHRWATYTRTPDGEIDTANVSDEKKADPAFAITPRYWISRSAVEDALISKQDPLYPLHVARRDKRRDSLAWWFRCWLWGHELLAGRNDAAARLRREMDDARIVSHDTMEIVMALEPERLWAERTASAMPLTQAEQKQLWHQVEADDGLISRDQRILGGKDSNQLSKGWEEIAEAILSKRSRPWVMGWRDICRSSDLRTVISSVLPAVGVGDKFLLLYPQTASPAHAAALLGNLNALVLDFVARQKIGGSSLKYFTFKQLPILPPEAYTEADLAFIIPRVLELTYTAHNLRPWAEDVITSYHRQFPNPPPLVPDPTSPTPFRFDSARRAQLRAELDAHYALLYGLTRDELRYILDPADTHGPDYPTETFRVLKANELKEYGEYRTQRLVLEAWDAQEALS